MISLWEIIGVLNAEKVKRDLMPSGEKIVSGFPAFWTGLYGP